KRHNVLYSETADFNERQPGCVRQILSCSASADRPSGGAEFQAPFFSRCEIDRGWVCAGIQHHVKWTLSVYFDLHDDLVLIKLERDFDKRLLLDKRVETAEYCQEATSQKVSDFHRSSVKKR